MPPNNNAYLLFALVVLIVLAPLQDPTSWSGLVFRGLIFATLLVALRSVADSPRQLKIGGTLAGLGALGNLYVIASGDGRAIPFSLVCLGLFTGQLVYVKIRRTMLSPRISSDMIYSALIAYLVACISWTCAYLLTELAYPGSFHGNLHSHRHFPTASPADLIYFSVTTMTTAGYGDISPSGGLSRNLAMLQMLFGTMYPSVVLARLVGLHCSDFSQISDTGNTLVAHTHTRGITPHDQHPIQPEAGCDRPHPGAS